MKVWLFIGTGAICLALAAALVGTGPGRHLLRGIKAEVEVRRLVWSLPGVRRQADLRVEMADGVRLATDLYLPGGAGPWPTILVRLPYGKTRNGEARAWIRLFAPAGYAVVVQDMRGRWASEGVFAPWPNAGPDGAATLDWIAAQPWSSGKVGTIGCSAMGEAQWPLAARAHPAHRAMIALGSGGAAGEIDGLWSFFGVFEGGILTLAPALGWFSHAGGKTPDRMAPVPVDTASGLATLPVRDAVAGLRPDPTDFETLLDGFGQIGWGAEQGYLTGRESIGPAVLLGDTWFDPSLPGALALWRLAVRAAPEARAMIGPGQHCDFTGPFRTGAVGDLPVARPDAENEGASTWAPEARFLAFMHRHLRSGPDPDLPPVEVYALGADQWEQYAQWPPAAAREFTLALGPGSFGGLGGIGQVRIPVDPMDTVPSVGGPICCTGNPADRPGPLDQRPIEGRGDLWTVTTPPLAAPLDIAGPMEARLTLATEGRDGDVVVRVAEVMPDGRSVTVQEGALRLRYRHGIAEPTPMVPGLAEQVHVPIRDTRRRIPVGHRLRLHVAGSSFPRLERPPGRIEAPGKADRLEANTLTLTFGPEVVGELAITSLTPPVFDEAR